MFCACPYLSLKNVNCMIVKSEHLIHVMVLTFYTKAEHLWNRSAFFMMWNFVKHTITNGITNKITNQNLRRVSFGKSDGPFNANPCACNTSPCYAPCFFQSLISYSILSTPDTLRMIVPLRIPFHIKSKSFMHFWIWTQSLTRKYCLAWAN